MKKGDTAELTRRWWKSHQPKGLATAPKLDAALKAYEAARARLEDDPSPETLKPALALLDKVAAAAKAVASEAAKHRTVPEMQATEAALDAIGIAAERRWAEAHAEDAEEGSLASPDTYVASLRRFLPRLRAGHLNFGLVLGKRPQHHRLVLHRITPARTLATKAARELKLTKFTFGTAAQSDDRPRTILLTVEGKQLPGMRKKAERMLARFKPLPFTRVALFIEGSEVEDLPDPEDMEDELEEADEAPPEEAALQARMKALAPEVREAVLAHPEQRPAITSALKDFMSAIETHDADAARRRLQDVQHQLEAAAEPDEEGAGRS